VSLLCLAVWLPATQHCQLEKLPGLAFLACATDTQGNSDCQGDSCDVVEHGAYKSPDNQQVAPSEMALIVAGFLSDCYRCEPLAGGLADIRIAPDLSQTWQFLTRAASSPRAPSFAS
jgi:hypothetical protein